MKTTRVYLGALAAGVLALPYPAWSATIDIMIDAGVRTSNTEAQCLFPVPTFTNNDCSYGQESLFSPPGQNWIGPGLTGAFYALGTAPEDYVNFTDPATDGRIGIPLSGTITIDDQDTPLSCENHLISGVIQMEAFSRNYQTQANQRQIDNYPNGITQTIAPQQVSAGTPNGDGGCDYVLGDDGVPELLAGPGGDLFPGQVPYANSTLGTTEWLAPGNVGLAPFEFNANVTPPTPANIGVSAVATIGDGAECFSAPAIACTPDQTLIWNTPAKASWDNIVGRVSTDANGNITDSLLFLVHVVAVVGPNDNSWLAYTVALSGTGPGGAGGDAVDDTAATGQDNPVDIDVLANDTNFADPVTVTVSTPPTNGGAVPVGSPGNQADIVITYTPDAGFFGVDSFQYTVDDGTSSDTATVNVTVSQLGANDDTATTRLNTPVDINVLANDVGFADPVTVTITAQGSNGGTAVVNGSPGEAASIDITFTPDQPLGTATYQETFSYSVQSGPNSDTAVVTVTVNNALPTAAPGAINTITTQGFDPSTRTGTFNAATGNSLGDAPAVVTADNGTSGTTSVMGTTVTYTPDDDFFAGVDTFDYTITDADGEEATNTVTVTIADVTPVVNNGNATGNQDTTLNASAAFTAGNGSVDQHALTVQTQAATGTCTPAVAGGNITVAYVPNAGFVGADTCVIRLADGDGDFDDGTYSFTVNAAGGGGGGGPGIQLPGGKGSMDLWSLALLGALPLLRRRRRLH